MVQPGAEPLANRVGQQHGAALEVEPAVAHVGEQKAAQLLVAQTVGHEKRPQRRPGRILGVDGRAEGVDVEGHRLTPLDRSHPDPCGRVGEEHAAPETPPDGGCVAVMNR